MCFLARDPPFLGPPAGCTFCLPPLFSLVQRFSGTRRPPLRPLLASRPNTLTTTAGVDAGLENVKVVERTEEWRQLGSLAAADASLLLFSTFSLVIAAACDVAIPAASSAALSAGWPVPVHV